MMAIQGFRTSAGSLFPSAAAFFVAAGFLNAPSAVALSPMSVTAKIALVSGEYLSAV
jgi:hypothetical protein